MKGLDKYLTAPPDNEYNDWVENVVECFSQNFYDENEEWIMSDDGLFDKWANRNHRQAANIIERAF